MDVAVGENAGTGSPTGKVLPAEVADAPEGYQDLTQIDQGGFAMVYRALDTRFDRTVALKILRSDSLDERRLRRFRAECLATGRVTSHPNIVTVYDAGTTRGHRPWLAMEYCSGGSLADKLARTGAMPVTEVVSIGVRLCGALGAAHSAGILHRDVKPHNVLLTSYGEPALADFGIARLVGEDDSGSVATETAAYTVVHAAPEILEGKAGTVAADIYSLGSTLYTLLAGQAPFAAEASIGLAPLVTRILRNDVPAIARPGVPQELEQLLRTCMAARPQDRPASASELGASLTSLGRRLAAGQGKRQCARRDAGAAPLAGARSGLSDVQGAGPPISARRLLVLLGGASGLLLAAFTAWGFSLQGSAPDDIRTSALATTAARTELHESATVPNPSTLSTGAPEVSGKYAPLGLAVARGQNGGELIVTWRMPIRPDVVATVISGGSGTSRARAIVTYHGSRPGAPATTLHGLPARRPVCLVATHVVLVGDQVASVVSRPVCAVPR
jgi:tRNA A-37 threonylcarbamoyl transferase component Bud32